MISLHSAPFTLLIKLEPGRRRLALPQQYAVLRRPATARSVRAAAAVAAESHLRQLEFARDCFPDEDRLLGYETLLVSHFLDILQDIHGSDFRRVVHTQQPKIHSILPVPGNSLMPCRAFRC